MENKTCTRCKKEKSVTLFYKRADYIKIIKYRSWCKECCDELPLSSDRRFYAIKKRHGLTKEQYEVLVSSQDNKCAICLIGFTSLVPKNIHVDHDHILGTIRGILCTNCNRGLGHFKDSPALLNNARIYITRHD